MGEKKRPQHVRPAGGGVTGQCLSGKGVGGQVISILRLIKQASFVVVFINFSVFEVHQGV